MHSHTIIISTMGVVTKKDVSLQQVLCILFPHIIFIKIDQNIGIEYNAHYMQISSNIMPYFQRPTFVISKSYCQGTIQYNSLQTQTLEGTNIYATNSRQPYHHVTIQQKKGGGDEKLGPHTTLGPHTMTFQNHVTFVTFTQSDPSTYFVYHNIGVWSWYMYSRRAARRNLDKFRWSFVDPIPFIP